MNINSLKREKGYRKRNETDIIRGILEWIIYNQGGKQTHLMYKVNLSHTQMKGYLDNLMARGYIDKHIGTKRLFVTRAGIDYYINLRISEKLIMGVMK